MKLDVKAIIEQAEAIVIRWADGVRTRDETLAEFSKLLDIEEQPKISLTSRLVQACNALKQAGEFGGFEVLEARTQPICQRRADLLNDGVSWEGAEAHLSDYCCVVFHLDLSPPWGQGNDYYECRLDQDQLMQDFREWLSGYIPVELIPDEIDLTGGDTEFQRK